MNNSKLPELPKIGIKKAATLKPTSGFVFMPIEIFNGLSEFKNLAELKILLLLLQKRLDKTYDMNRMHQFDDDPEYNLDKLSETEKELLFERLKNSYSYALSQSEIMTKTGISNKEFLEGMNILKQKNLVKESIDVNSVCFFEVIYKEII